MKRTALILAFLLCFTRTVFAISAGFMGSGQTIDASSCPPWYTQSIVSWNGLHDDGHNTLCETDGTANAADTDTATTVATGGWVQLEIDDSATAGGEYLRWNDVYLDGSDAAQTICLEIFVHTDTPSAAAGLFEGGDLSDDIVLFNLDTGQDRVYANFYTQAGPSPNAYGATLQMDGWETVAYSWDVVGAADDHSINAGDEAIPGDEDSWADEWEDDPGEVTSDMTTASVAIKIGDRYANGADSGEYYYIRKFALVNGYKVNCRSLTGW